MPPIGRVATIAAAVKAPGNTIEYQGAVRHVPSDRYFSAEKCWESAVSAVNTYQSGAFWHTPTGWLVEALQETDPDLARQVARRFMRHLREGDFRRAKAAAHRGNASASTWPTPKIRFT